MSFDFSGVRVHADDRAGAAAAGIGARAFTLGSDVVFGRGEYQPDTSSGRRLLAHELAHVVQHASGQAPAGRLARQAAPALGPAPVIQHAPEDEPACPKREADEVRVSRSEAGQLKNDVFTFPIGSDDLLIADFGVDSSGVKQSAKNDPILGANLSVFESDASYRLSIRGYSDCAGPESINTELRMGRAGAIFNLLGPKARSRVAVQGMAPLGDYVTDNTSVENRAKNRGVVIKRERVKPTDGKKTEEQKPPATVSTKDVKLVVKSFIAPIGSNVGITPCQMRSMNFTRLAALAKQTDRAFSENPVDDKKDKGYRLYSEHTFKVACDKGKLLSSSSNQLDTDVGDECMDVPLIGKQCLHPPPLITDSDTETKDASSVQFSWAVKGRPHPMAEPTFQIICGRTGVFIWHTIDGKIECNGQDPKVVSTQIKGSGFPSHRAFVNGSATNSIKQGFFGLLWDTDASDPMRVR